MIPETIAGYAAPLVLLIATVGVWFFGRQLGLKTKAKRNAALILAGLFVFAGGIGWMSSELGSDVPEATYAQGNNAASVNYARLGASSGAVTFSEDSLNKQLLKANVADTDLNDSDTVSDLNFTLELVRSNSAAAACTVSVSSSDFRNEGDSSDVVLYNLFQKDTSGHPHVYVNGIQGGTTVGFAEAATSATVTITGRLSDAAVETLEQYSTRDVTIRACGETVTARVISTTA